MVKQVGSVLDSVVKQVGHRSSLHTEREASGSSELLQLSAQVLRRIRELQRRASNLAEQMGGAGDWQEGMPLNDGHVPPLDCTEKFRWSFWIRGASQPCEPYAERLRERRLPARALGRCRAFRILVEHGAHRSPQGEERGASIGRCETDATGATRPRARRSYLRCCGTGKRLRLIPILTLSNLRSPNRG